MAAPSCAGICSLISVISGGDHGPFALLPPPGCGCGASRRCLAGSRLSRLAHPCTAPAEPHRAGKRVVRCGAQPCLCLLWCLGLLQASITPGCGQGSPQGLMGTRALALELASRGAWHSHTDTRDSQGTCTPCSQHPWHTPHSTHTRPWGSHSPVGVLEVDVDFLCRSQELWKGGKGAGC